MKLGTSDLRHIKHSKSTRTVQRDRELKFATELLEERRLLSFSSLADAGDVPRSADRDDQFSEADQLHDLGAIAGPITNSISMTDSVEFPGDVDMFRFAVTGRQTVYFDIDTPSNGPPGLGSYLRIFSSDGLELAANNDKLAPGETPGPDSGSDGFDSYIEYTFNTGGTYYAGVSNWQHRTYNAITGANALGNDPKWLTGSYEFVISSEGDPNDQISEALSLGNMRDVRTQMGTIDENDVDMFSFNVKAQQKIAFDIDGFEGTIRVFDPGGAELAGNHRGKAPREILTHEGYLEYVFETAGMYFVGISGNANRTYDAKTGGGDTRTNEGSYSLVVTPITWMNPFELGNAFSGKATIPNPNFYHVASVHTFFERVNRQGNPGANINARLNTWIVIHGRQDNVEQFRSLAGELVTKTGDQVLLFDWRAGARNNLGPAGLEGAEWIPYIADWARGSLKLLDIGASRIILVGHSWGSYVAYETASRLVQVKGLVALDPARDGLAYPQQQIHFDQVAKISWAFYGSGEFGSAALAGTAHEAFAITYRGGEPSNPLPKHRAPIHVFETIVRDNDVALRNFNGLFDLSRLRNPRRQTKFVSDVYQDGSVVEHPRRVFEGVFRVIESSAPERPGGSFWRPFSFRYFDSNTREQVII